MSVGVMKDYKLKQRNLRVSHTLGKDGYSQRSEVTNWIMIYVIKFV